MSEVPVGLSGAGEQFWTEVTSSYKLRIDERRILEDACRMMCLIDRLEKSDENEDMLKRGSMGQEVINPLFTELRQQRAGLAKLLSQLRLPDLNADGKTAAETGSAEAGRLLAAKRWGTA